MEWYVLGCRYFSNENVFLWSACMECIRHFIYIKLVKTLHSLKECMKTGSLERVET
jgi:hypothetical protein